MILWNL